jgi:hypothetical protein
MDQLGAHGNAVAIGEIWNSAPKIEIPLFTSML